MVAKKKSAEDKILTKRDKETLKYLKEQDSEVLNKDMHQLLQQLQQNILSTQSHEASLELLQEEGEIYGKFGHNLYMRVDATKPDHIKAIKTSIKSIKYNSDYYMQQIKLIQEELKERLEKKEGDKAKVSAPKKEEKPKK